MPARNIERFPTEEQLKLQRIIAALKFAHRAGFSSTSSPKVPLLDAIIDLLLIAGSELSDPDPSGVYLNPEVRFFYNQKPNEMGNTRSVNIKKFKPDPWFPEAKKLFDALAEVLVLIKREEISKVFMTLKDRLREIAPEIFKEVKQDSKPTKKRHKNSAYFRRQRRKVTKY